MDFLERLSDNPDYQELLKEVKERRARLCEGLVYLNPANYRDLQTFYAEEERIRGRIHGIDDFLRAPDTARQLLSQREMNDE